MSESYSDNTSSDASIAASNASTSAHTAESAVNEDYAPIIYKHPQEVKTKLEIAKNVLKSCLTFGKRQWLPSDISTLTGLPKSEIGKIYCDHDSDNDRKTFKYYLINYVDSNNLVPTIGYDVLRQLILPHYLERYNVFPSIRTLLDDVWEKLNLPCAGDKGYTADKLKRDLFINGFILECYPGSRKQFIIEDPKNVMNRVLYFEKMADYRKNLRTIVHVETKVADFLITVCPKHVIKQCFSRVLDKEEAEKAIINDLIPILPINSVVVLDVDLRRSVAKLPNEYSSKKIMEKWLTMNHIPYPDCLHKAELYKLVMRYKPTANEKYYLQEIIENYGHTVLWKPKLSNIYSFTGILKLMLKRLMVNELDASVLENKFKNDINNISLAAWHDYDKFVAEQEQRCLSEDLMMTEVVDHIKLGARNWCPVLQGLNNCDHRDLVEDPEFLQSIIITNESC